MPYSDQFEEALIYATRLHADQHRKNTEVPYVTHLMAVAALVAEYGGDENQVIAALLHDAVEDQGGAPRLAEIRQRFGDNVARMVDDCTDTDQSPKPPWRERKEAYIAHLRDVDERSLLVSAADKVHNGRSIIATWREIGDRVFERFNGGRPGALWYFRAVFAALRNRGETPIVAELGRMVDDLERLAGGSVTAN